ncbi:hypothetical protein EST38_g13292 [Candolleomyces aberdarensis]|uniref:Myb-like domain-containing protein n=1 Tax=Candolleomyces aberdarensis TaxID=2316362 RepID=A0A4Q2D062_9AGAR|nr:hypothetical protein EST38_g13292 [Candolleomyces aberdarensis]
MPWQDRLLAQEVYKLQPFDNEHGKATQEAWSNLAQQLAKDNEQTGDGASSKIERTGEACKARFLKLLDFQCKEETASKQKTGTDEEVTSHIQVMTELLQLWDNHLVAKQSKKMQEKQKISWETKASLELRDAAMKGCVSRDSLMDIAELPGASVREKQGQRGLKRKNGGLLFDESDKENRANTNDRPSKKRRSELTSVVESRVEADKKLLQDAMKLEEQRQQELRDMHSSLGRGLGQVSQALAALTDFQCVQAERDAEQRAQDAKRRASEAERQLQLQHTMLELMKRLMN